MKENYNNLKELRDKVGLKQLLLFSWRL